MSKRTGKPIRRESQTEAFKDALRYMKEFMDGNVQTLKTPWPKFDDALLDGIEWQTLIVVGARPGTGKTLFVEQIVREAFRLNPGLTFRVLKFQFEMVGKTSSIREFSGVVNKSYKELCNKNLDPVIWDKCFQHAAQVTQFPINVVYEQCTVTDFIATVEDEMEKFCYYEKDKDGNTVKKYTRMLITIDHSYLFKKDSFEKDKHEMLNNLGEALTDLKRRYPIAFILLSQLNRNIDNPERNEDGKYGNYILESDLFGADALLQHADTVVGINKPAKQKIRYYGPDRYIIEDENTLAFHFLKCRNGDTRLSFFKAEFHNMRIVEMQTPATQDRKLSTK
jgi:replicative DNA helicase